MISPGILAALGLAVVANADRTLSDERAVAYALKKLNQAPVVENEADDDLIAGCKLLVEKGEATKLATYGTYTYYLKAEPTPKGFTITGFVATRLDGTTIDPDAVHAERMRWANPQGANEKPIADEIEDIRAGAKDALAKCHAVRIDFAERSNTALVAFYQLVKILGLAWEPPSEEYPDGRILGFVPSDDPNDLWAVAKMLRDAWDAAQVPAYNPFADERRAA